MGCGVLGQVLGLVVSRLGGEYRGVRSFRFGDFFVFSLFFFVFSFNCGVFTFSDVYSIFFVFSRLKTKHPQLKTKN